MHVIFAGDVETIRVQGADGQPLAFVLEPLGCAIDDRIVACDGVMLDTADGPVLFVGENESTPERRSDLESLLRMRGRMLLVHEAGHLVSMRLHGRAIAGVWIDGTAARVQQVDHIGDELEGAPADVEVALYIEWMTTARAGLFAAEHLLGWRGEAGSENDLALVETTMQMLAPHGDAYDRAAEEVARRLAIIVRDHRDEIVRVADALAAASSATIEGEELRKIAGLVRPRISW